MNGALKRIRTRALPASTYLAFTGVPSAISESHCVGRVLETNS